MKIALTFLLSLTCIQLHACNRDSEIESVNNSKVTAKTDTMKLKVTVGTDVFIAKLRNNATVAALKAKLPMTVNMKELNRKEKYFDLSDNLPQNPSNPRKIQTGDLMLYGANTLVLFYKTFSTSYSYSKIGRIENPEGLANALGSGNVTVKFELE